GKLGRLGSGGSLHAHSLSASKPGKSAAASRRGSSPADVGRGSWCPPRCGQAITAARDSTTRLPVPVCMRTLRTRRPRPSTIPVAARVHRSLLADRVVLRPNDRTLCVPERRPVTRVRFCHRDRRPVGRRRTAAFPSIEDDRPSRLLHFPFVGEVRVQYRPLVAVVADNPT